MCSLSLLCALEDVSTHLPAPHIMPELDAVLSARMDSSLLGTLGQNKLFLLKMLLRHGVFITATEKELIGS